MYIFCHFWMEWLGIDLKSWDWVIFWVIVVDLRTSYFESFETPSPNPQVQILPSRCNLRILTMSVFSLYFAVRNLNSSILPVWFFLCFILCPLTLVGFCALIFSSYNNRKKSFWKYLYVAMLGLFLIRLNEVIFVSIVQGPHPFVLTSHYVV